MSYDLEVPYAGILCINLAAYMIDDILAFWFGSLGHVDFGKPQAKWFRKDPQFDQEICDRFLSTYKQAVAGACEHWQQDVQSCLALLLLLDQFPRNMFRGTPQAFATDAQAVSVAQSVIDRNLDQNLAYIQRWFVYLPFEHSEQWEHQQQSLRLWQSLQDHPDSTSAIDYAQRHADIIQRFGRFPHRNKILGRESTPEEKDFLRQRGSSF